MSEKLAIDGGVPVRTRPWPKWPVYGEKHERALLDVLHSGAWGIGGKRVAEFEQAYADLHKAKHGVACTNGTVALEIALFAAGVKPGDEVITSPYTFMASAQAAVAVGAVPVFVDVEEGTHNLDPKLVEAAITDRTAAIMPVHIGGRPADMDALLEIGRRRKIAIVEDAAQAWMAAWRGTPVGAIGDCGGFSFQSSKNITAGEGGIVLANDDAVYQRAWSYHNCGRVLGGEWYQHDISGYNFRLTEFQAALLLAGLEALPAQQAKRNAAMAELDRLLADVPELSTPTPDPRITAHAAHIYMFRFDPKKVKIAKMDFVKAMYAEGVPAGPGYTLPVYKQNFWKWLEDRPTATGRPWRDYVRVPYESYNLPVCERLC
ncbi:MAG TPA: DegT/DnrJ/EryC1/StrS family aminotransferase, partial [Acidobacteriota bacterium]|nr:DegT/DnrJ/EryC1/StrS family aminotransferase [Acidobacteriota bacterium]